jgi:hypothetical protein
MKADGTWHKNAKKFYKDVTSSFSIPNEMAEVFLSACAALSMFSVCSDDVHQRGPLIEGRANPALNLASQMHQCFLRGIKVIGIDVDEQAPKRPIGRPPKGV